MFSKISKDCLIRKTFALRFRSFLRQHYVQVIKTISRFRKTKFVINEIIADFVVINSLFVFTWRDVCSGTSQQEL